MLSALNDNTLIASEAFAAALAAPEAIAAALAAPEAIAAALTVSAANSCRHCTIENPAP